MLCLYVGDAKDIVKRILTNHCTGNVEGSAFRKAVAEAIGYNLTYTKRKSKTTRVRIDLPNPREGEKKVSEYIWSGYWRYVICQSYDEAYDFQWYLIDQLNPLLNKKCNSWNEIKLQRYEDLLIMLNASPLLNRSQLKGKLSGHGIYVFYHEQTPPKMHQ